MKRRLLEKVLRLCKFPSVNMKVSTHKYQKKPSLQKFILAKDIKLSIAKFYKINL